MNMTQLAATLGVNRATLYRRIKSAGIDVDEYRQEGTDELTAQGISVIGSLFDGSEQRTADDGPETVDLAVLTVQLEAARREAELLREQLAEARKATDKADAATEAARADAAAWRKSFETMQAHLLAAGDPPATQANTHATPAEQGEQAEHSEHTSDASNVRGWRARLAAWLTRER